MSSFRLNFKLFSGIDWRLIPGITVEDATVPLELWFPETVLDSL